MVAPLEDRAWLQLIAVPDVMFSEECLISASISRRINSLQVADTVTLRKLQIRIVHNPEDSGSND